MNQTYFKSSNWYNATMLTERLVSLRTLEHRLPTIDVDADLVELRLERWRSQPPFEIGSYFEQRLAMDGMSEDELRYILGEPIEAVRGRFPVRPVWLSQLDQAYSSPSAPDSPSLPKTRSSQDIAVFLDVFEPLISQGRERIREGVGALTLIYTKLPFNPEAVEEVLSTTLPSQLAMVLDRTMALELNVARLQGLLQGDTADERFQSFLHLAGQHERASALLQEYPVLARQLMIRINHWASFSLEFLQNLCADWEAIRTTFSSGNDPGVLVQVEGSLGDTHRGGRSVLVARFSSGFQVVYKPKSLAVDVHFQELLIWLNDHGDHIPFRTLRILDRGAYGWVEFASGASCSSVAEIQRFYERQGGYLALLYALEATDFHYENIIAAGEHPMLIDLEALFHPRVGGLEVKEADELADSRLSYSVLRIGLLPERIWSNAESEGIDISGLGAAGGQLTPFRVSQWEGVGTDEMRLIRKRVPMSGSQNRPTLVSTDVNAIDYTDEIVTGFTHIYELLRRHRDELISIDGPLARFAGDEVRVLARSTWVYSTLLHESFHPDVLRNALDRDRLFDRLWVQAAHYPYLARLIPDEREDLQKGDIPMFTTCPESRDLWSSSRNQIAGFFEHSGMELVRQRLQQLSEDDLRQQLWFIRASLATLSTDINRASQPTSNPTEPQTLANREQVLEAARAVGDRLEALALRVKQDASWIGLTLTYERCWSLVRLGTDLYDGLPGVVLFLAYLGSITQEARYTALARAALATMRRQVERSQSFITAIGGFTGWGGLIYTLTHLSALWEEPTLLSDAETTVERLLPLIERDEQFDISGGAAGCIGSLISLYHNAHSKRALAAAVQCGDHLVAHAQAMEQGVGWVPRFVGQRPLTGFSHGAAGIAWALLKLAVLTNEERFRGAALAAIAYERNLFSAEAGNWPDLRESETPSGAENNHQASFVTAWCHGAPGIGLARLSSLPHLDDTQTMSEINAALTTTLAHGFGGNHSLCHGDLGNLELLLQASQVLDDPLWHVELSRRVSILLESINRDGWLCGIPTRIETPGLMTGLAGIGYQLLRLAEPTRVPSVLTLEPPILRV